MRIEYRKVVKVDELAQIIPMNAGASYGLLWRIFYTTRLLKYVHLKQYGKIAKSFNKICTFKKLKTLCELGYFKSPKENIYCATDKVLPIIKEYGYLTDVLPAEPEGKGDINELNNTEAFIHLLKTPYFLTFLYPQFGKPKPYLIPDALMVQLNKENRKYKLTFIEVERKKPEWDQYIKSKLENYDYLSQNLDFYNSWSKNCEYLSLPKPKIETLKFDVKIIKDINFTF